MHPNDRFEYDVQRRARAGTGATLRVVVAGYILYLAWQLVINVRAGETTMPPAIAWLAAAVFTLAAIAFLVYTWKRWRREVEAARLPAAETDRTEEET